jgi:endonuclease YncB( thermonuclease family)
VAFVKYSTDYTQLEKGPRAQKLGIWQSQTQPPWEYRARRWETAQHVSLRAIMGYQRGCDLISGKA